jgi:hypothetical protein
MWLPFLYTHIHFTVSIFVSLISFAVSWLYLDAWITKKSLREGSRVLGFFLLGISFAINSTKIETSIFGTSVLPDNWLFWTVFSSRIAGYLLILLGHILDPLQAKPKAAIFLPPVVSNIFTFLITPFLSLFVAIMYLRRATFGLERHLKNVAFAFFVLTISESCTAFTYYQNTTNITLYKLVAPYGPIWLISHIFLFIFALILLRWVTGYLLKRFSSQLIITFTTLILAVFMFTTIGFTGVLIKNLETQNLIQLETDSKILQFALISQQNTLLSDTQMIASHPDIIKMTGGSDRKLLAATLQTFLLNKKQTSTTVVNPEGKIIARGDDSEKFGEVLSDDSLLKRVLTTGATTTFIVTSGPTSPIISIQALAPIIDTNNKTLGVVITSSVLDNAFLDNLKTSTGLEASFYGNSKLSSTTITTPDGVTRPVGITESNTQVIDQVLSKNQPFTGSVKLFGHYYLSAYLPLKNIDGKPIGMIFVGRDQVSILHTAGLAIQTTFMVTLILLLFSLLPSTIIARSITHQIK